MHSLQLCMLVVLFSTEFLVRILLVLLLVIILNSSRNYMVWFQVLDHLRIICRFFFFFFFFFLKIKCK